MDKWRKIVITILLIPFFLGISMSIGLPPWFYIPFSFGIPIILILRLIVPKNTVDAILVKLRIAPAGQQASRWDSLRSKISFGGIVKLAILLVIIGLLYGVINAISGTPDRIYPAKELQNLTTSGTWKLQGDELVCNGNYYNSCEIVIPNQGNIGGLTIDPGMTALPDTDVNIGDKYLIKYYFQNLTNCNGKVDGKKYHRAIILYDGIAVNDFCSNDEDDGSAKPLWVGTPYYRLIGSFPGLMYKGVEFPKVYIGVWNIRTSYINDNNLEYLGGKIKISSKKTIAIREIRIAHSSYQWRELFYKTVGL